MRLLYCSLEEAELIFRAALAAGQAGPSHMWFAVGPALSGLGLEGLPKALFAVRPQGWRDEPRRYEHTRLRSLAFYFFWGLELELSAGFKLAMTHFYSV